MRVLIVDDDKHVSRLVRAMLESENIECHEAADGIEGLTAARELHPDVMFLDVMLPGLDGYKVCRMLKFDENFADITIVMLTSRSRSKDKETGFETGADLYITKPFDRKEILDAIRQFSGSNVKTK
jgi:two-component system alkaline phosphatase synthesis response regulator PhoP